MNIKKAVFQASAGLGSGYPAPLVAEIALVGRSNVGKSSLINALCNNSKLARISSRPGKTRLINYFIINEEYYLVDLPGYGFADASKSEIEKWGTLIEEYLQAKRVTHIFLLLDIRHEPTLHDKAMMQWINYYALPYTLVATKADKLSRAQRERNCKILTGSLGAVSPPICVSAVEKSGLQQLDERIFCIVEDSKEMRAIALDN